MILSPRKAKYKKEQKGKAFNKIINTYQLTNGLAFGSYGLKAIEHGRVSSKQIETMYQSLNKFLKKRGKIFIKIFPHTPITSKPIEVRMGKGKGNVDFWVSKVKAGVCLCEVETNFKSLALKALNQIKAKLPIKTKIYITLF
jgi:large subunit ribosomal protein L16